MYGQIEAVLEQNSHIVCKGRHRVGRLATDIDDLALSVLLLVMQVGCVLNNIGQRSRAERNQGCFSYNRPLHSLDLLKVSVYQSIFITLQPQSLNVIACTV